MAFSSEEILVSFLEDTAGSYYDTAMGDHMSGYHLVGEGTRKVRDRRAYFKWYNKHKRKTK